MGRKRRVASVGVLAVLLGLNLGSGEALAAGPTKITKCQTITQPGSYLVDNNLTATGDCLVIAADFVTLDLGGFVLTGNGTGAGVTDNFTDHKGIVVRNGMVTNFSTGILLHGAGSVVEGVRSINNGGTGIAVGFGTVTGNTAANNGFYGIFAGSGIVAGNMASDNGSDGIVGLASGSVVTGNVARSNGRNGINGGFQGAVFTGNAAYGNGGKGIVAAGSVTGNSAAGNGGHGIQVAGGVATGNDAVSNGADGLHVLCPSNVIGNKATFNTGANLAEDTTFGACSDSNNLAP